MFLHFWQVGLLVEEVQVKGTFIAVWLNLKLTTHEENNQLFYCAAPGVCKGMAQNYLPAAS